MNCGQRRPYGGGERCVIEPAHAEIVWHVQSEAIEQFGQQMIEHHGAAAATLLAMGSIVEHLDQSGREARDNFADRFEQFDGKAVRRSIEQIGRA